MYHLVCFYRLANAGIFITLDTDNISLECGNCYNWQTKEHLPTDQQNTSEIHTEEVSENPLQNTLVTLITTTFYLVNLIIAGNE